MADAPNNIPPGDDDDGPETHAPTEETSEEKRTREERRTQEEAQGANRGVGNRRKIDEQQEKLFGAPKPTTPATVPEKALVQVSPKAETETIPARLAPCLLCYSPTYNLADCAACRIELKMRREQEKMEAEQARFAAENPGKPPWPVAKLTKDEERMLETEANPKCRACNGVGSFQETRENYFPCSSCLKQRYQEFKGRFVQQIEAWEKGTPSTPEVERGPRPVADLTDDEMSSLESHARQNCPKCSGNGISREKDGVFPCSKCLVNSYSEYKKRHAERIRKWENGDAS